jgi:hypothetical protein
MYTTSVWNKNFRASLRHEIMTWRGKFERPHITVWPPPAVIVPQTSHRYISAYRMTRLAKIEQWHSKVLSLSKYNS